MTLLHPFARLGGHGDPSHDHLFDEARRRAGLRMAFNPSIAVFSGRTFIAFRGSSDGAGPYRAYLTSEGSESPPTDLTEIAAAHGIDRVSDPKLFHFRDELWVTFNSGFVREGDNEIYIQRVAPSVDQPQVCRLTDRQKIEKNWAFYENAGGRLAVVYSLSPLTLLNIIEGTPGTGPLSFERSTAEVSDAAAGLTIGTQLSFMPDGAVLLVAHEKVQVARKRAYFGRAVELDLRQGAERVVRVSSRRLIHSFGSLIPRRARPNPNLISATYFSGLCQSEDGLLLSYGINDSAGAIAAVTREHLW